MTDAYPDSGPSQLQLSERVHRSLIWLLVVRVIIAAAAVGLILFLFRWSSAIKREDVPWSVQGLTAPEEWKVVVPEYAGGGRGSRLVGLKPWRFGTMNEHPFQVGFCVAVVVALGGAFIWCSVRALRLKTPRELDASPSEPGARGI